MGEDQEQLISSLMFLGRLLNSIPFSLFRKQNRYLPFIFQEKFHPLSTHLPATVGAEVKTGIQQRKSQAKSPMWLSGIPHSRCRLLPFRAHISKKPDSGARLGHNLVTPMETVGVLTCNFTTKPSVCSFPPFLSQHSLSVQGAVTGPLLCVRTRRSANNAGVSLTHILFLCSPQAKRCLL